MDAEIEETDEEVLAGTPLEFARDGDLDGVSGECFKCSYVGAEAIVEGATESQEPRSDVEPGGGTDIIPGAHVRLFGYVRKNPVPRGEGVVAMNEEGGNENTACAILMISDVNCSDQSLRHT